MRVEQVVVYATLRLVGAVGGAVAEGAPEEFHTLVGLQGAGPEVHLPPHGPAGGGQSAQGEAAHGGSVVGARCRQVGKGIERHEVAEMAVAGLAAVAGGEVGVFPFAQDGGASGYAFAGGTSVGLRVEPVVEFIKLFLQLI